jgi:hypothetical protein
MNIIYNLAFLLFFQFFFSCNQKTDTTGTAKIIFKSTDGGQTWQDISKGLPENLREDRIHGNSFFANDKGLFLRVGNGLYNRLVKTSLVFIVTAFSDHQTREKHGNYYFLLQKIRSSIYLFQAM